VIAEIENKESNNSEDELTGNFFGNLRYISFNKGLKQVLKNCVGSQRLKDVIDNIHAERWDDRVVFWRRYPEGEPDILLEFNNAVIVIEVKFNSDLSSSDQLDKYLKLLDNHAGDREKILILLAREGAARNIYNRYLETRTADNALVGYLSWQKALDALNIKDLCPFESVIINDVKKLLDIKGFGGFRNFDVSPKSVVKNELWSFDCIDSVTNKFSFGVNQNVERSLYYAFR